MILDCPPPSFWSSTAPQWFAAIGTFALAIVALFQQWFQRLVVRPKLRLDAHVSPPDAEKTRWRDGTDVYYFRLAVTNTGNAEARDVQVYLASVEKLRQDNTYESLDRFSPMNLLWAHLGSATRAVLVPKMPPVFCDLAYICDPKRLTKDAEGAVVQLAPGVPILVLQLEVKPYSGGHLLEPHIYRFHIKLVAANHKPIPYTLDVNFPGKWFDDKNQMFSDGFGMRIL